MWNYSKYECFPTNRRILKVGNVNKINNLLKKIFRK
jgi:hypothetical protein